MIEITRGKSVYSYRICPTDPRVVERRENKRGQHWYFWLRRDSANEAKAALLNLGKEEGE